MKGFTSLPNVPGPTAGFGLGASPARETVAKIGLMVRIEITNQNGPEACNSIDISTLLADPDRLVTALKGP